MKANKTDDREFYKKKKADEFQQMKFESNLKELQFLFGETKQFDDQLKEFKQNFYTYFSNPSDFLKKVKHLIDVLDKIDRFVRKSEEDVLGEDFSLAGLEECKNHLNELYNNSSLLSKTCFDNYVAPLVGIFGNFKSQLEKYYQSFNKTKYPPANAHHSDSSISNDSDIQAYDPSVIQNHYSSIIDKVVANYFDVEQENEEAIHRLCDLLINKAQPDTSSGSHEKR